MSRAADFSRTSAVARIEAREDPWDVVVIGGGATGIGVALDAATRGLDVLLLERGDFGEGTSSRSTKLVHGGVRYLQQGNVTLVRDALRERSLLRRNASHLVRDLRFVIPCRHWPQRLFYGLGLKLYDALARGGGGFGRSHGVGATELRRLLPTLRDGIASGGVVYHDGQFDDARLLITMARTAWDHGGCLVNYLQATGLLKDRRGNVRGVQVRDVLSGVSREVAARSVINAAGPFGDDIRRMDDAETDPLLATSQGVHVVLPREFFPGDVALIIPRTRDGRVLFLIPWYGRVVVGTTDTAIPEPVREPLAQPQEIAFLLETAAEYLERSPGTDDVLSVFTGIRPLVRGDRSSRTASLSRDHRVVVADSGLITITGGKWTTVRKMGEDGVDRAIRHAGLRAGPCRTAGLRLHGSPDVPGEPPSRSRRQEDRYSGSRPYPPWETVYGGERPTVDALAAESPEAEKYLANGLPFRGADVIWATRNEMAETVEDVLARRTRLLFLDARAAVAAAPDVAKLIARERGHGADWCGRQVQAFSQSASHYLPDPAGRHGPVGDGG